MTDERYRFEALRDLLRRPDRDPAVLAVFGAEAIGAIERDEYYGSIELQAEGFDVVFEKAPFVVPAEEVVDPDESLVAGFHFRREGHDGFAQYSLALPGGLAFGDDADTVRGKLGAPEKVGGGKWIPLLKKMGPAFWLYPLDREQLHVEFNDTDRVQMVTLQVPSRLDELAAAASGPAPR